jgi:hypothetical protein
MCESFVSKEQGMILKSLSGDGAPFAPMSFGPSDATEEEHGKDGSGNYKTGQFAVSFKNNNPELCEKDIAVSVLISAIPS